MDGFNLETSETKLKLLINDLLLTLHALLKSSTQPLNPSFTSSQRTVQIFLDALPDRLDIDWTLEGMAQHCHMGRTLFSKLCAELTNQSPMKFLLKCRVDKAEKLLQETGLSISDIAYDCGFATSQYLSSQFKKVRGISPREVRKKG